ncbi:hypothetical protein V1525DRAFT_144934 [Lipomyces kononenkoae]|uniref:Uncharacterized protein n=1 Tax=Lipomyces kononenkoae TaxID=34357 RepID=A0ACC3T1K7_LIPKO
MPVQFPHPTKKGELLPTLQELINSNQKDVPKEAAWIWGPDDEVGRLNLLSPELVKRVSQSEAKFGLVSSLNWDITLPLHPPFGRPALKYDIQANPNALIHDDTVVMNTQSGSQFDGFRHFGHISRQVMYNGLTRDEIVGPNRSLRCGMQACSKHGIVGRGVLLDFELYAQQKEIQYDPFKRYGISLEQLKEMAELQGVEFEYGDILLIRTGWMKKYNELLAQGNIAELEQTGAASPTAIGIDQGDDMKYWLHDQYFSVVGGDQPAFEAWPSRTAECLHEYLLACWGVLIGETLDLEDLAEKCKTTGKYSFLFMSAPFNSPGGVATFANALCVL